MFPREGVAFQRENEELQKKVPEALINGAAEGAGNQTPGTSGV